MPLLYRRILDAQALSTGDTMDLAEAIDLGEYTVLEITVVVSEAGAGESAALLFQHAPCNEAGRYMDFATPLKVDLTHAGTTWEHIDAFTRFLTWSVTGTLNSSAVATVDIVAKG